MRSTDYGANWSTVADDLAMTAEVSFFQGITYSPLTDRLYICTNSDEVTERVFALLNATQPTVGALQDLSFNLDALFPEGSGRGTIARQGLAL